jgi:hypothetical protein
MTGIWKSVASAVAAIVVVGLAAGTIQIARVDTVQIAEQAIRDIPRNGDPSRVLARRDLASDRNDEEFTAARILYGYYGELDKDGKKTNVLKETHNLRFSESSPIVVGSISGPASYQGKPIQRTWLVRGFARDPELVLNILTISSKDDPKPPTGIGTYYLATNEANRDYTGTAVYLDCDHKVVQCPYALTSEDLSPQQAKVRWPELFKQECKPINLTPDAKSSPLSC